MNQYIKNIHINKLFHLNNFDIPIDKADYPHLLITGKNGSGKTILLNAIADYLDQIKTDTNFNFLKYEKHKDFCQGQSLSSTISHAEQVSYKKRAEEWDEKIRALRGRVEISFDEVEAIIDKYSHGDFVIAMYKAYRKPEMFQPKNPTKPEYKKKG